MAILATRRRWLVTSWWAASVSPCSCQLLASMNSWSLASIGNLRISDRYRLRPPSGDMTASAFAAMVYPLSDPADVRVNRVLRARLATCRPSNHLDRYEVAAQLGRREEDDPKYPTAILG